MNARTMGSPLRAAALPVLILIAAACGASTEVSPGPTGAATPPATAGTPTGSAPSPSGGASEEPGASPPLFVDLITSTVAKVRLEVDDRTGTLTGATTGSPGDGASVAPDAPTAVNVDPSTIRVTWSAGPCDSDPAIFIDADRLLLVQPPCPDPSDSIALDRIVDLHFSKPTDSRTFDLRIQEGRDTAA